MNLLKRKPVKPDATLILMEAMIAGSSSAAVRSQEKQGQRSFVESEVLPTDLREGAKVLLKEAGVKFLGIVEDDPIFQYVELPAGWKKKATGHDMWSDLLDEKGRKRAMIFYKAAFYDRSSHLDMCRRYSFEFDYGRLDKEGVAVAVVKDQDAVIYTTDPIPVTTNDELKPRVYEAQEEARGKAKAWLNEHFPAWQDDSAYWDDDDQGDQNVHTAGETVKE